MTIPDRLLEQLAVRPDGDGLWIGARVSKDEEALVKEKRSSVLAALRERQLDLTGFYTCVPLLLEDEIRAAGTAVLHIETTAPTRFSPALRVRATTRIGEDPWSTYRATHVGVRANSTPRMRVLCVSLEQMGTLCFDWDRLSRDDRARLLSALFSHNKVVGHNLTYTFSWLYAETSARAKSMEDTMLLVQHLQPSALLRPYAWAARPDETRRSIGERMLHSSRGKVELSLDYIAKCCRAPGTTTLNTFQAWSLDGLSAQHLEHCHVRLRQIRHIHDELRNYKTRNYALGLDCPLHVYSDHLNFGSELAGAHVRGVPLNKRIAEHLMDEVPPTQRSLLAGLLRQSDPGGRIHTVMTLDTVTGRSVSRSPALQNIPRDPDWRALIGAKPGHRILSVDYAGMELRVAAALASRAVQDIEQRGLKGSWWTKLVMLGKHASRPLASPSSAAQRDSAWYRAATLKAGQRVLGQGSQTMKTVLQSGIDPHLVTAANFARRSGRLDLPEDVLATLKLMTPPDRHQLKAELATERQLAKACNFGLLYGMGPRGLHQYGEINYGLSWTLEEAVRAHDAWFDLYPEIRLWHLWTKYCCSREVGCKLKLWDKNRQGLQSTDYPVRLFEVQTLAQRPLVALASLSQALSYQGQGTGADILARAVRQLPAELKSSLLFPVHDELVFEVPSNQAESMRVEIEVAMREAARGMLGSDIPVLLDAELGETWC